MPPRNQKQPIRLRSQLIKTQDAANLLGVDVRTINKWIKEERIPFVELPRSGMRRNFRIPLQGLLNSLSGTYDLSAEIAELYDATE